MVSPLPGKYNNIEIVNTFKLKFMTDIECWCFSQQAKLSLKVPDNFMTWDALMYN